MIGLSVRTVDNLIAQGCPHLKLGARCLRFNMEEVHAWFINKFQQKPRGPFTPGRLRGAINSTGRKST